MQIIYTIAAGWTNLHTSCPSLSRSFPSTLQVGVRSARSLPVGEFNADNTEYSKYYISICKLLIYIAAEQGLFNKPIALQNQLLVCPDGYYMYSLYKFTQTVPETVQRLVNVTKPTISIFSNRK
jgi:hypothetical protein